MKKSILNIISILLLLLTVTEGALAQSEKTRSRLDVEYHNTEINERFLKLKVTTRVNRRYQPVPGAEIEIYLNNKNEDSKLGNKNVNKDGVGTFLLPSKFFKVLDTLSEFTFICTLTDHPEVTDKEVELLIQEVELKTEFIDQDTLKWIRAILFEKDGPGAFTPLEDIEVEFYVTRPFNMLPISEAVSTDEEGKATVLFPDDLPGDATGHVVAVVKINDSDDYGTIEKKETVQWGIPTTFSDDSVKRSLWAAGANAPLYLLLLTNSLIFITWGIIFYIVYQIYRISKL